MPRRRNSLRHSGGGRLLQFSCVMVFGAVVPGARAESPPRVVPCASVGGFYTTAQVFQAHVAQLGMVATASWDFTPNDLPPASSVVLADPLNVNTHALNANDPWTNGGGQNFWPPALNSVQFSSNTTPEGPLTPRGPNGLTFATSGFFGSNIVLGANVSADSFDIVFESPASARCQAMAIEIVGAGVFRVRVDFLDGVILKQSETYVNVPQNQKVFLGCIKSRIVRVDIWNSSGGVEGISSISAYIRPRRLDIAGYNDVVDVDDLLVVINNWGQGGGNIADVTRDGIVNVDDLLAIINAWGPLSDPQCLGDNPSQGACIGDGQCFPLGCDHTACTPSTCFCDDSGQWVCTDDCCGHCS